MYSCNAPQIHAQENAKVEHGYAREQQSNEIMVITPEDSLF
jgi:hypothetical protein